MTYGSYYRKPAAWAIAFTMLLCALLASLSACRRDGTEQDPEGTPLPTAEAAVTEAPSETPAPTAAITAKPASTPVPAVEFKSAAIEAQVREQLKIGQDKAITSQMLMGLEHVYLHGEEITDLSDIRKFVGAEVISIASAPNANFAEFDAPSNLKELSINNCGLTDVSFISNISSLIILDLEDNEIEDVSPIAGLRQLKYLQLENNRISDISPLMEMRGLSDVMLSFNPIPLEQIDALRELVERYGDPDYGPHVSFYTGDLTRTACWPMDLNGDGEDEYFCVRLDWLDIDFVSYAWLESADGRRLSDIMFCGTGHVAHCSFALVESPEYGTCLMRLDPEFIGQEYGYSLYKLVDGKLQSVCDENFYNYDSEQVQSYDPDEAKAYQKKVRELISSGTVLISTDAYGLLKGELVEVTAKGERVFTLSNNEIQAIICTHGIIGSGVDYLKNCEYPDRFVIVEGRLLYNIVVDPYTGEN